jgi:hypothetical protein
MNRAVARFALILFALTMSVGAFAASDTHYVVLDHDTQLNGKTLPAGHYNVKCDKNGSTAQVTFLKDGKEVASANGQVKQLENSLEYNQVVTRGDKGSSVLSEIDFAKTKTGVTFESSGMSSAGGQ